MKAMLYFERSAEVHLPQVEERGRSSGRPEDNKQMFPRRYVRFMESSLPIREYFEREGLLRTVDVPRSIFSIDA
ncbi:hypothetical protein G7Y79_00003g008920 [Physcia stellaris]|nr:hypothetical protein G7Y79_00003g008920 [Physcia stellaris]